MNQFRTILMATDFTTASAPAWRRAVEMAAENGAALVVAHAYVQPSYLEAGPMAPRLYQECDEHLRSDVEKRIQLLINDAERSGVTARPLVLVGNPEEAIVEAALKHDVDLIVMGTHGRKGVSRLFLGSVASRVIASSPCAVLTVRVDHVAEPSVTFEEKAMAECA